MSSIIKLCNKCGKLIVYPNTYCQYCKLIYEEQKKKNEQLSNRRYNQKRDKKYIQFYKSIEWQMLRNKKLQDTNYKCEICGSLATEVHHLKPVQTHWDKRLDYTNLKTVCVKCHNDYHDRFKRKER